MSIDIVRKNAGENLNLVELFAEFVRLRQLGTSRDEAWRGIEAAASRLSHREHNRLLTLLIRWEANEGQNYKPSREDPQATPPTPLAPKSEELSDRHGTLVRNPLIRRIVPTAQQAEEEAPAVTCPSCHKPNAQGELYCYYCGSLLLQVGKTQRIPTAQHEDAGDAAYFDDTMALYLEIRGASRPLGLHPREDEMVIGRRSADSPMVPDIDLAPYQAEKLGVSRMHAGLRRQGTSLLLTDLDSLNHTYINGQQLHPREIRVLHDNDELRLGQLVMRVSFRSG